MTVSMNFISAARDFAIRLRILSYDNLLLCVEARDNRLSATPTLLEQSTRLVCALPHTTKRAASLARNEGTARNPLVTYNSWPDHCVAK